MKTNPLSLESVLAFELAGSQSQLAKCQRQYFGNLKDLLKVIAIETRLLILMVMALKSTIGFSQNATVNLNTTAQTIKGFGGINHPEWYSDLNAAERQLAYGNGTGQLGLTVLRTFVSDNSANFNRGLATTQYAFNNGALVFASPWNPAVARLQPSDDYE